LDALEGDPEFLSRTCDCRDVVEARKANKRAEILKGRVLTEAMKKGEGDDGAMEEDEVGGGEELSVLGVLLDDGDGDEEDMDISSDDEGETGGGE